MPSKDTPKTEKSAVAEAEAGNAEVQQKMDEATAKGFVGDVADPHPNSAYSIQSGPDAPALVDDDRTRFHQPGAAPGPGETKEK